MAPRKPQNVDKSINITATVSQDDRSQTLIHLADAARANADALTGNAQALSAIAVAIGANVPLVSVNQAKD